MAYGYGNNQNNGRRMTLQERLDAMRKTAIQGHYGFSQDDTPKERLKKRLKALRDGYGTIPQSSWTNRQEQQEQDTTSPSMRFDPQHNEAAPQGAGTTANRTGAGTGSERRFDQLYNTPAAAGGQDGVSRPGSVTPTTVETTPTSTRQQDNRTLEQRWLDMIADQRREREEAADAGNARPDQTYTLQDATTQTQEPEDYQGELDRIATIMPMIDRLEKAVRTGALSPDQQRELDEARAALSPYLPDLAQTNSADELHNNLEYLARQRQDIQNRQNLGTLLQNQDAMGAYEKKDEFTQDLTDLNYMISDLVNGGRADSDRYKELKEKYSLTDSMLAGYVRAVQTGIEEEDWEEAGLTDWQSVANLKNHLQDNINRYSERMTEAGVDPDQLEEYITRTQKEQDVLEQAERNREYMQESPLQWLFGSAVSVFGNIGSSFEALDMFLRNWDNNDPLSEDYRPYSAADLPTTVYTQALREGGAEGTATTFRNVFGGGEGVGRFLYNTGMSIADSATVMAAAAATAGAAGLPMAAAEAMTLFTMGGTAASNAALDVIQRGGSNQQIMTESIASGVFEALFEKFSVDRILKPSHVGTVKALAKETLKQAGIEASEEMATEIANIVADAAIMTDKSDYQMAVQQYRADFINNQGYNYDDADKAARAAAIGDMVRRVGEAGLGGALSGAVMGGVHNFQGMRYESAVLENARNGIALNAEQRENISRNVLDGEGLLAEHDQLIQEYRARHAEEIAARSAQNGQETAQNGENGQGDTDTRQDGQNGNQDEQGPDDGQNRRGLTQSMQEWMDKYRERQQARRQQRETRREGRVFAARDMRTYRDGEAGRGILTTGDYANLNRLARSSGQNIYIVDDVENQDVQGWYKDGSIYITESALRSGSSAWTTAVHEASHALKETAPQQYARLQRAAAAMYGSEENMIRTLQQASARSGVELTAEEAADEGVAVLMERMAYNPNLFERVAFRDMNAAQQIWITVRNELGNIRDAITHRELSNTERVVNAWGDALDEARRTARTRRQGTTTEGTDNGQDTAAPPPAPAAEGDQTTTAPTLENGQGLRAGPETEGETAAPQTEGETVTEETGEETAAQNEGEETVTPEAGEEQTAEPVPLEQRSVEELQRMLDEQRNNPTMTPEEMVELATVLYQKQQQQAETPVLQGDGLTAGPVEQDQAREDQERQAREEAAEERREAAETEEQTTETEETPQEQMPALQGEGLTAGPTVEEQEQTKAQEEQTQQEEEERQRAAKQARQEQLRQQRWRRQQNETRTQWLDRLYADRLSGQLTQEEFERGIDDYSRSRQDSVMASLQNALPMLANEEGLRAGDLTEEEQAAARVQSLLPSEETTEAEGAAEAEETADGTEAENTEETRETAEPDDGTRAYQDRVISQIQDLMQHDTTLRNLAQMQRQGILTDAQYANLRDAALRANDRYQSLVRSLTWTNIDQTQSAQEQGQAVQDEERTPQPRSEVERTQQRVQDELTMGDISYDEAQIQLRMAEAAQLPVRSEGLETEDGLRAGELTETEQRIQDITQQMADLEESIPALRGSRQNMGQGYLSQEAYEQQRQETLQNNERYLDLRRQLTEARNNRFQESNPEYEQQAAQIRDSYERAGLAEHYDRIQQAKQDYLNEDDTVQWIQQTYERGDMTQAERDAEMLDYLTNSTEWQNLLTQERNLANRRDGATAETAEDLPRLLPADMIEEQQTRSADAENRAEAPTLAEIRQQARQEAQQREQAEIEEQVQEFARQTSDPSVTVEQAQNRMAEISREMAEQSPDMMALEDSRRADAITEDEYRQRRAQILLANTEYREMARAIIAKGLNQIQQQEQTQRDGRMYRLQSTSEAVEAALALQQQLEQDNKELRKTNKRLERRVAYYMEQWKITNRQQADPAKVQEYVRREMDYYGSQAYLDSVLEKVTAAYDRMATLDPTKVDITQDQQVNELLQEAAEEIVRNAYEDWAAEYGDDPMVDYIRTTAIDITGLEEEIKSRYDTMKNFRKEMRGILRIATKAQSSNAQSPAGLVQELESTFGTRITQGDSEAEALFSLIQYVERMTEENWQPSFDEEGVQAESANLAAKLKESFFTLPKVRETRMDRLQQKQQQELDKLEKKYQKRIDQMNRENEQTEAYLKSRIERTKTRAAMEQQQIRARHAAADLARRNNQTSRELRDKIYRHAMQLSHKLLNPSDKQHIPDTLRDATKALLESLDLESSFGYTDDTRTSRRPNKVTITTTNEDGTTTVQEMRREDLYPTKRTEAARALSKALTELRDSGLSEITIDPDLANKLDQVANFPDRMVSELDKEQLQVLWEAITSLEHAVTNANKMLGRSRIENVSDLAVQIIKTANQDRSRRDATRQDKYNYLGIVGIVDNLLQVEQLTPETFFHRMGPGGDELFRQARRAQEDQVFILNEGRQVFKNAMKSAGIDEKQVRAWEKDQDADGHTFTFEGTEETRSIKLSTGQILELWLLSQREQAIDHITIGGIQSKVGETTAKKFGVPIKVKNTSADAVFIGAEGINTITKGLTDQQKTFAKALQNYLAGGLAARGNMASVEVYGYSKFTEQNYWPITTQSESNQVDFTKGRDNANGANMISSYGMAKATVPNARNPVVLRNVTDTFARHLDQMATYAAWLSTSENLAKVYNYKLMEESTEGKRLNTTVRSAVNKIMGDQGDTYWRNLLFDIAIGTKAGAERSITDAGLNAFKAAAVGANIRVILQQPTAIIRAAEMLNPKYLTKVKSPFRAFERAKQHSGIAQWKDWGYFELDTGRNLRELMLGEDSALDKVKNGMMAGAGMADNFAWGILWNGVEAETRDLHPEVLEGSQEFWDICAERFGAIIDRTQVVDSVLHRSQIMRSTGGLNRLATSFMSEPTKVYNMIVRDIYDIGQAIRTGDKAAVKAARQHVARTAAALIISFAVNGIARAIPDFFRSDDRDKDGKTFWDEWWENFASDFDPLSYIPYLRDIESIIQGFDVERSDLSGISDLVQSAQALVQAVNGEGKKSVFNAGQAMARKGAAALGLPVDNLVRDATAIFNTCLWKSGNYVLTYNLDKIMLNQGNKANDATFYDTLYRAMMDDNKQYRTIYQDMIANGYSEESIKSAMEQRLWKEAQEKWAGEDDITATGSGLLPVEWKAPGKDTKWDKFLEEIRDEDNWADVIGDDYWGMAATLQDAPTGNSKEATAEKRRMIADQPYTEDIKEDAMEAILSEGAFKKYMAARAAGVSTYNYVDLLEDMEAEAERVRVKEGKKTATITMDIVEKILKQSGLTSKQKAAIWKSYSSAKNPVSPWG